jgi:hypothetical protein
MMEVSIMAKSSKKPGLRKPHPDFPLFPHKGTNHWAKKIRGKIHYFGKVLPDDPQGEKALEIWRDQKDDLLAGRTPRAKAHQMGQSSPHYCYGNPGERISWDTGLDREILLGGIRHASVGVAITSEPR